ncbi:ATP-dependent DNA helicase PIF1-like protein [Tanacetum coccineum]
MAPETATAKPQLFLENLELGVTVTIVLMFCRMWDVYAANDAHAAGYVTNVGRIVQQKTGSTTLDFHLANSRGQSVRVTLWGSLRELLIEKEPAMLGCRLYLSSTSSTLILDDEEIPEVKQLKADSSGAEFSKEMPPVGCLEVKAGTLENLLMWSRNQKHDSATFHCTVHIDNVRTKNGWNFPSCEGEKCKKSITRSNGRFLCESCNKTMDYPVLRYRLELEVSDDTTEVVVAMFNETATSLVKCTADSIVEYEDQGDDHSPLPQALANIVGTNHTLEFKSHTYYEHNTYESFTYWRIVTAEGMGENGGSSMAGGSRASETPEFKTQKAEESDAKASFVTDTQTASRVGGSRPDTRKNKRYLGNTRPRQSQYTYQQAIASTSNYPFSDAHRRKTGATTKCKSRNATKGMHLPQEPRFPTIILVHHRTNVSTVMQACELGPSFLKRYAQVWFFDTTNEVRNRMGAFIDKDNSDAMDATTVQSLIQMLDHHSSVAKAFRMARDWCHSHASINVELHLLSERTNARQYNKPTVAKQRNDQGNTLVRGGRLFQQYLVDAYSAIEEQCLKWTRNNQDTLRVDFYHNVCDVVTRGDTNATGLGQRIVLPVVYFIEFEKRGLPHAHILLWLEDNSKCKTAAQIDDIISAELPSPTDDPNGYKEVTDYMLHGPCAKDGRYAPCITEGKCFKLYPKQFYTETVLDEDGYPIYRRRDNKASFKKGKFTYDNRHVVPHNRYLLLKYQAHINENVQKGDHVTSEKVVTVDEINNYLNCRYLASCEALCSKGKNRLLNPSLGKALFSQNVADVVRGPKDFDELMTVNNRLCHTFKEACFAYGLLNDDREWKKAISEASLWALGPQLCDLFVTILLFCDISRPLKLWEETWEFLSEDILHKKWKLYNYPELQLSIEQIQNYCLVEIQELLNRNGRSLIDFQDLPRPNPQLLTNMDNCLIREALNFDMNKVGLNMKGFTRY